MRACVLSRFNPVWLSTIPWTIAHQAPLGFSRQENWSGQPFPSPGDLPNPGLPHCRWTLHQLSHSGQFKISCSSCTGGFLILWTLLMVGGAPRLDIKRLTPCCSFPHSLWPRIKQQILSSRTWEGLSGGSKSSYSSPELYEVQPRVILVCDFSEPSRPTVQQGVPRT